MFNSRGRALAAVILATLLAAPTIEGALPLDSVQDKQVRADLRQTGLNITFGKTMRAMIDANSIGWNVFHRGRADMARELSYALALQGVAEAELGMEREALWHWAAARIILPDLESELLASYADIVGMFESSPMRDQESAVTWLKQKGEFLEPAGDVSVPVARRKQNFTVPSKRRGALEDASVTVSFLVDPRGRAFTPTILEGEEQSLAVFTVLQSLLAWEFEPASKAGRPGWSLAARTFSFR